MSYVLITGASSGIGDIFARALANQKQNLILTARRRERLDALASELKQAHGIEVEVITADLVAADGYRQIAEHVNHHGWALSGLINNAGFGDRGHFSDLALDRQLNMIQVNISALVALTWTLIPNLKQTTNSFIINVASVAAFQAGPDMAVYYASKAFVLSFSEALTEELKRDGISVSALCPGPTKTEFFAEANLQDAKFFTLFGMSAESVVNSALAGRRRAIVIPGIMNKLMVWLGKLSPRIINRKLAGWLQSVR